MTIQTVVGCAPAVPSVRTDLASVLSTHGYFRALLIPLLTGWYLRESETGADGGHQPDYGARVLAERQPCRADNRKLAALRFR